MDGKSRSSTIQERTRSCSSEERRSCPSTKYGFPRRSMPAARFCQWHFNRRARNSCLHLHRVVSSFRLFFSPRVSLPWSSGPDAARGFALRIYMSRRKRACRARCGCRCAWNYSRINTCISNRRRTHISTHV